MAQGGEGKGERGNQPKRLFKSCPSPFSLLQHLFLCLCVYRLHRELWKQQENTGRAEMCAFVGACWGCKWEVHVFGEGTHTPAVCQWDTSTSTHGLLIISSQRRPSMEYHSSPLLSPSLIDGWITSTWTTERQTPIFGAIFFFDWLDKKHNLNGFVFLLRLLNQETAAKDLTDSCPLLFLLMTLFALNSFFWFLILCLKDRNKFPLQLDFSLFLWNHL